MTRRDQIRIAMVAVPAVAAIALFVVAFKQRGNFVRDVEKRQIVERQINDLLKALESQAHQPEARQAAVVDEPTEESRYLTFIRSTAQANGVKIVRWASNPRLPAPPPGAPNAAPPSPALAGVTPLSGTLEIAGSYRQILAFTRVLESNPRLLNLTNVSWMRPDNKGFDVHLSANVTRYVIQPTLVAGPNSVPVAPANNNS